MQQNWQTSKNGHNSYTLDENGFSGNTESSAFRFVSAETTTTCYTDNVYAANTVSSSFPTSQTSTAFQ